MLVRHRLTKTLYEPCRCAARIKASSSLIGIVRPVPFDVFALPTRIVLSIKSTWVQVREIASPALMPVSSNKGISVANAECAYFANHQAMTNRMPLQRRPHPDCLFRVCTLRWNKRPTRANNLTGNCRVAQANSVKILGFRGFCTMKV